MEVNAREQAFEAIEKLEGNTISAVQILCSDTGNCITQIVGPGEVITTALAYSMKENKPLRKLFEEAWCMSQSLDIK